MTKTIQTTNAEAKTLSEKEQPTEKIALETMSQPIKINKTKLMVELLSAENGSSIKELASKLNWLENSVPKTTPNTHIPPKRWTVSDITA